MRSEAPARAYPTSVVSRRLGALRPSEGLVWLAWSVVGVVAAATAASAWGFEQSAEIMGDVGEIVLLVTATAACLVARSRRIQPLFSGFMALGFGLWTAVEILILITPDWVATPALIIGTDLSYVLVFLLFLLAAEEGILRQRKLTIKRGDRRLSRSLLLFLVFGFTLYFALIPSAVDPASLATMVPSYLLYLSLDLAVLAAFLILAATAHQRSDRFRLGLIALSFGGWAAIDLADAIINFQNVDGLGPTMLDLFWFAPFALVTQAVLKPVEGASSGPFQDPGSPVDTERMLFNALVLAAMLPLIHAGGYWMGWLGPASREARGQAVFVLVVITLAAVGSRLLVLSTQRRLRDRMEQSERLEAIGRLAGGVAHDFNNLLTVITGQSGLLLDEYDFEGPARARIEEIQRAAEMAGNLTRQLLAFSRGEPHRICTMELNAVVVGLDVMLSRVLGERHRLELALDPEAGSIRADPAHIEQLLVNLIVNARDASSKGAEITVRTESVTKGERGLGPDSVPPGKWTKLTVADQGIGMGDDTISRIFEPFFSTKKTGRGTGLGLATVMGVVRQNSALIQVESTPYSGTRFLVYFPQIADTESSSASEAPGLPVPRDTGKILADGATVLLVEDDPVVRLTTRAILERDGFEVLEADGAANAKRLLAARGNEIRLLVTDVVMPETSGPELVEQVSRSHPHLKVLFLSGYTFEEFANLYDPRYPLLEKPFGPDDLTQKVVEVLGHE